MANAPVLVQRIMRRARKDHEATTNAQTQIGDQRSLVPGGASGEASGLAGDLGTASAGHGRMMATPAARRAMATPVSAGNPEHLPQPGRVRAPARATRPAGWSRTGRRRRRPMARLPGRTSGPAPRRTLQIPRLGLAELAADRRGAPVLVVGVLLIASVAAGFPKGVVGAAGDATGPAAGSGFSSNRGIAPLGRYTALSGEPGDGEADSSVTADAPRVTELRRLAEPADAGLKGSVSAGAPQGGRGTVGAESSPVAESFSSDGTLIKPFAVDTTVPTIADQLRTYKVREGDSLSGIAARFRVSTMTLWWANRLKGKDELSIGQQIVIPPADGILYTVKEGDTLASVGKEYQVAPRQIVDFNKLEGTALVLGQVLLLPGGRGDPIPVPAAIPAEEPVLVARRAGARARPSPTRVASASSEARSARRSSASASGAGGESARGARSGGRAASDCRSCSFSGAMSWPVAGGHISQRYHSGHYGLDIAADYGTSVIAAAPGKVIFAGWRSNGGGYQVWISHGRNLYTTYNHMSSVSVGSGAMVGRGQRIGRIGATGWATGPHLHFEVWRGPIWSGGSRANPLRYL